MNTPRAIVAWLVLMAPLTLAQAPLYTCDGATSDADLVGLGLCDAVATETLVSRAEADNLQVRHGALVDRVADAGISQSAGLQRGDMIYRVGGVDVESASAAVDALSGVSSSSDTVVNFLRGGRPYRVKLRREEP